MNIKEMFKKKKCPFIFSLTKCLQLVYWSKQSILWSECKRQWVKLHSTFNVKKNYSIFCEQMYGKQFIFYRTSVFSNA